MPRPFSLTARSRIPGAAPLVDLHCHSVFSDGEAYEDVPGFCYSASYEDVQKHGFVLTPGRYVGAEEIEDDGEPFSEKMDRLSDQLVIQIAERNKVEEVILSKLRGMGYEV